MYRADGVDIVVHFFAAELLRIGADRKTADVASAQVVEDRMNLDLSSGGSGTVSESTEIPNGMISARPSKLRQGTSVTTKCSICPCEASAPVEKTSDESLA